MAARAVPGSVYAPDWDRFVASCPGDNLVQTEAWANSKQRLGFATRNVILRENGAIVGGASMIVKRVGPMGAVGYVARGPLLARPDRTLAARLVDALEAAARAAGVWHLIVQAPEGGELLDAELAARGYSADGPPPAPPATMRLSLTDGPDALFGAMSRSKRRAIRSSRVSLREGGRDAMATFHALHVQSAARQGFAPLSLDYLRHKWDCLAPQGFFRLVIAYVDDEPCAGLIVSSFNGYATARIVGWSGCHPRRYANEGCDWWAIRWASEQGMRWYDVGGIDRRIAERLAAEGRVAAGQDAAAYKLGFGGTPVLFPLARQRCLHVAARPFVTLASYALRRSHRLRQVVHRVRNG